MSSPIGRPGSSLVPPFLAMSSGKLGSPGRCHPLHNGSGTPPQCDSWLALKVTRKPVEAGMRNMAVTLGPALCLLGHAHSLISPPPLLGPPAFLPASAVSMAPLAGELILMSKID